MSPRTVAEKIAVLHGLTCAMFLLCCFATATLAEVTRLPAKRVPTQQDRDDRFAVFDNHKVHYRSYGQGEEAIVFIHGAMGNLANWRLQEHAFDGRSRVILIDLPGHGQSDKP